MTKQLSHILPIPRSYTQDVGVPKTTATILSWSSLTKLEGSFKNPGYKVGAGKHGFTDPVLSGSHNQAFDDVLFDLVAFIGRQGAYEVVVFLPKTSTESTISDGDLQNRSQAVREIGQGGGLLRYVLNRDITPPNPAEFFKDTSFENSD